MVIIFAFSTRAIKLKLISDNLKFFLKNFHLQERKERMNLLKKINIFKKDDRGGAGVGGGQNVVNFVADPGFWNNSEMTSEKKASTQVTKIAPILIRKAPFDFIKRGKPPSLAIPGNAGSCSGPPATARPLSADYHPYKYSFQASFGAFMSKLVRHLKIHTWRNWIQDQFFPEFFIRLLTKTRDSPMPRMSLACELYRYTNK